MCLSVKSHLTYGASVRPENAVTYSAGNEGQKICGVFSEDAPLLRSSGVPVVFHTFRWPFFFIAKAVRMRIGIHSYGCRTAGNTQLAQRLSTTSALPKTKPLALVGARTDSITRYSYKTRDVANFRARALAYKCTRRDDAMRRGFCTLVLFILSLTLGAHAQRGLQ